MLNLIAHRHDPIASRRDLRFLLSSLTASDEQYAAFRAALDPDNDAADLLARMQAIRADGDCISLKKLAVHGTDIAALGFQDRQIHTVLHTLLDAVMRDEVPDEAGALKAYAAWFLPGQEKK